MFHDYSRADSVTNTRQLPLAEEPRPRITEIAESGVCTSTVDTFSCGRVRDHSGGHIAFARPDPGRPDSRASWRMLAEWDQVELSEALDLALLARQFRAQATLRRRRALRIIARL